MKAQKEQDVLHDYLITILPEKTNQDNQNIIGEIFTATMERLSSIFFPKNGVVAGTTTADVEKEKRNREIIFQQQTLLNTASRFINSKPWIPYLVAIRLAPFLDYFEISTAGFADFADKKVLDKLLQRADALERNAFQLIPNDIKTAISEMLRLEAIRNKLSQASLIASRIDTSPYKELVISKLRGIPVEIQRRTFQRPKKLNAFQIFMYTTFGNLCSILGVIFLAALIAKAQEEAVDTLWFSMPVLMIIAGISLVIAHENHKDKLKEYENQVQKETMRINRIKSDVDNLALKFQREIEPVISNMELTLDKVLDDIKIVQESAERLLNYAFELRECLAEI